MHQSWLGHHLLSCAKLDETAGKKLKLHPRIYCTVSSWTTALLQCVSIYLFSFLCQLFGFIKWLFTECKLKVAVYPANNQQQLKLHLSMEYIYRNKSSNGRGVVSNNIFLWWTFSAGDSLIIDFSVVVAFPKIFENL